MKKRLLSCFFIFISIACYCQPFYFRHYETEEGLSNNTVITALQDRYGFMWFGTPDGLNRFDGNSFKIYRHSSLGNSIGNNAVYYLHEDHNGNLWIGTEKGIYRYNPDQDNFETLPGIAGQTVRSICSDTNGALWIVSGNTLFRYNMLTKTLRMQYLPGLRNITTIFKPGNNDDLWIGTSSGQIACLRSGLFTIYNISQTDLNSVECIQGAGDGQLLIGTSREGLKRFDIHKKTVTGMINGGSEVFVRNILQVADSTFFINTENGLYVYNTITNSFRHITKNILNPYSLSDNALYSLCKDREGGIWIGSYFGGINYLPNQHIIFEKYFPTGEPNALSGNAIREITKDNYGNLWIGSEDGGLTKYNTQQQFFTKYYPDRTNKLSSSNIHGLLALDNKLLIGTFEHGLDIMNIHTGIIEQHFTAGKGPATLKSNFINKILKTTYNDILVCTGNGLFHFDIKHNSFTLQPGLPANAFYSAIAEDSKGRIWVGTHNEGLFYIKDNRVTPFEITAGSFKNTRILYIMEDTDKQIWVCTINGMYQVDPLTHKAILYNAENGMPGNIIYSIVQDNNNNFWIPTSQGLANMDYKTRHIKLFTQSSGLLNNQFNFQSVYKDSSGNIYMGSVKGMIKFNPTAFRADSYIPPIYITNLQHPDAIAKTGSGAPLNQSMLFTKSLQLPHDQSTFSIEFAALSFTSPANIFYEYKINNGTWYETGNNKKIFFTDLAPGKYNITIRSTNADGVWVSNDKSLSIEILPPFWRSGLAYVLYVLLAVLIMYAVFKFYAGRQKEKQQLFTLNKEKELFQSKMDFFTHITHEIKTPLTLIKVPLEKILSSAGELPHLQKHLQIMNGNTQRLLELTNQLLDFRKAESDHYKLYLADVDIVALTALLWNRFLPALEQKNIIHQFDHPDREIIISADTDAVTKIISNLIDNAVKYCLQSVRMQLFENPDGKSIAIMIENDGPLVAAEARANIFEPFSRHNEVAVTGAGIGLSLARSLALLHKGNISYFTEKEMNVFLLELPVKK